MKIRRLLIALFSAGLFAALAVNTGFHLYWTQSLGPRLQRLGGVDDVTAQTEVRRVQYVEETANQFLKIPPSRITPRKIFPVPELNLTAAQKQTINRARQLTVWFKRGEFIRRAGIDSGWMNNLADVELWRTPYGSARAKDGPFLGATWAFVHLAAISRMGMNEFETLKTLEDVRQLERLLLSSESHILNLQALQVMGIERDFVERHRRLYSYLNRWPLAPAEFAAQYRTTSGWLPKIWNWGVSATLAQKISAAAKSNPIFCSAMERGMSDALNFRPLLASQDPDFFLRQARWGTEWATVCHRPEFAKAWNNFKYVPRGVPEWTASWNGTPSRWLKMKHVMWWKSARTLLGGQVWLEKLLELGSFDDPEESN